MARPNNTVAPLGANRDEANDDTDRENRRLYIFIDGDKDEERRMVTLEEFLQFVAEKPEWLYEKLCSVHQQYEKRLNDREAQFAEEKLRGKAKDGEIARLHREMGELKGQLQSQTDNNDNEDMNGLHQPVDDVKQQLAEVRAERNVYANQIVRTTMQFSSISDQESTLAVPSNRETSKIPDPPMFTDGKEPQFENWLALMSRKLTGNADHFDTPQLRMAYVASRCKGKARKHITLRMREDAKNPYADSKDILDHLKMIFSDPGRVIIAKHHFRQLYMKVSDKFHDFLSEFLYLAAEAGIAEDDWKDELYYKLTTKLQKLCISDHIKDSTFQEFSSAVSQTASRLEVINHRNQKNRSFNFFLISKDTTKGASQVIVKKGLAPPRSIGPVGPHTGTNRDQLMKEGRRFDCQKSGHLARNCTTKAVSSELKELEQNEASKIDNYAEKF